MFAIVDTDSREVQEILEERPKPGEYPSQLLPVYVTKSEAASLHPPSDEWVARPDEPNMHDLVHTPGTIVPQAVLDDAIARQDQLKARLQQILTVAKALNGRSFDSLNNTEIKQLLQLQLGMNGMLDINGYIDLTDFEIGDLQIRFRAARSEPPGPPSPGAH